jgi:hypothetical protein
MFAGRILSLLTANADVRSGAMVVKVALPL